MDGSLVLKTSAYFDLHIYHLIAPNFVIKFVMMWSFASVTNRQYFYKLA